MKRTKVLGALLAAMAALVSVGSPGVSARPRSAPPAPTISAAASPTLLVVNQSSTVSGKVTPATTTRTVILQRKIGGVWSDRSSASVNTSTGAYKIPMKPTGVGMYTLRVRSAGGTVVSRTIYIRVWRSKQVFSKTGSYSSPRTLFSGMYNTVSSSPKSGCRYMATLVGIPGDLASNFIIPGGSGGVPATKYDMNIPRANYTVKVETTASCPWTIIFWRY